ncbi:MAG: hypothetical protein ACRELF_14140, partial [Gemmataceae bacterium]
WYVFAQVVLLVWMDESWPLNRIRVERDKFKQLHERLAEAPDRPLVLMLGSSRSDWAFQAGRLSGQPGPDGRTLLAYNMAVPTTGGMHEALYLNDLLEEGVRPRLVLLELVTTHLNQSRRGLLSEEHFTVSRWISAHQLYFLSRYFTNKRRALNEWLEGRLMPWYGFRWSVHQHLLGNHSMPQPFDPARRPMDDFGWRLLGTDPGTKGFRTFRWFSAFKMYGETLRNFRLGAKPAQAMRDVIARCRQEHIPVALVLMPIAPEFRELFPPPGRAELKNFLAELRADYGIDVIDATNWVEKKDFDDGHHVLKEGAYVFTTKLIAEVKKLLVRTSPPEEQPATP